MKFLVVALACVAAVAAEPEAEADPALLYAGYAAAPYAYGAYAPHAYAGYAPYSYGYYGYPYNYGYAGHYLGKREAEAEADPSLLYTAGYAPYAYAPYAYSPYYWGPTAASYQSIATPFSVSTVSQLHKREAEAEADPSLLYTAGYAPYAYAPYAYAPYYWGPTGASYQHVATPFSVSTVSQLHKREAEADAEADPSLLYAPLAYTYAPGVAAHPGFGASFEHRSPQGLGAALYRPYGYYGYGYF